MKHCDIDDKGKSSRVILALLALAAAPALAACAGTPITSPIDGEPLCPDFESGASHTKMAGGLHFPVQITIKSGSSVLFKTVLLGRRSESDAPSRVLLPDDNDKLTVEWGQCENERATKAVASLGQEAKGVAKYECGKAETYKTEELVTKKGDPKSHALTFATPPNAACWQGTAPPPAPTATPTASADADAGAPADAGGAEDAGAASADAGQSDAGAAAAADAGAADAGQSDAGKGAAAPK